MRTRNYMRFKGVLRSRGGLLALVPLLVWIAAPAPAEAQHRHKPEYDDEEYYEDDHRHDRHRRHGYGPRWELGGGFAVAVPQGEFSRFVDEGYGLGIHAVYALDRDGAVGLRFDGGFVTYGSERFTVPLLPSTGRVLVDVKTRNNIGILGIGPQLQLPSGAIRPFVNGFVGLGYFFTESSVGGSSDFDFDDFARTTNFDDVSFAYGGGGGLGLRLGRGYRPVYLNFEVQYRNHGETEYLREGSIVDDGFGGLIISPLLSEADFLLFQVGVSIGL